MLENMRSENNDAHGFNERMLTVNDCIDILVYTIVDFLKGGTTVWVIPWVLRLGDQLDYQWGKVSVEFLLVRLCQVPYFPCFHNFLLWSMSD